MSFCREMETHDLNFSNVDCSDSILDIFGGDYVCDFQGSVQLDVVMGDTLVSQSVGSGLMNELEDNLMTNQLSVHEDLSIDDYAVDFDVYFLVDNSDQPNSTCSSNVISEAVGKLKNDLNTSTSDCEDISSLYEYALDLNYILTDHDLENSQTMSSSNDNQVLEVGQEMMQPSFNNTMVDFAGEHYQQQRILEEPRALSTGSQLPPTNHVVDKLPFTCNAATKEVGPGRSIVPPAEPIGVTFHKNNKQWEAHLWVKERQLHKRKKKGVQMFLGNFQTMDEAMVAHDLAALKLGVKESKNGKPYPLNFLESTHAAFLAEHSDWSTRDFVWKIRRNSNKFSKGRCSMKGVTVRKRAQGKKLYEAKINQTMNEGQKRMFDLGKFECEEDAGRAYDLALLFFKGKDSDCVTNFRPSSYTAEEIEKVGNNLQSEIMET